MRSMKANFWMGVGILVVFILFTSLANAGGKEGSSTTISPKVDGWWEVSLFGTSLDQNKVREVVAEDMWVFANPSLCQDSWCQAELRVFKMEGWQWKEVGSGSFSLPPAGNSLWYNLYYYETGNSYYGSIFHFGNEMEGGFQGDKWDCPLGVEYCTLTLISFGRTTFRR